MRRVRRTFVSTVVALSITACSLGTRSTSDEARAAAAAIPQSLVLMPIGDDRDTPFEQVELSRYVRDAAVRVLDRKGFAALPRDEIEKIGLPALRGLDTLSASELAALAPPGSDGLLFLSLTRVERAYGYGGEEYAVTLVGVVVDARSKSIVWRGSGSGRTSLGGFLRVLSPSSPAYDAIYEALQHLFRDVPKRRA